MPLNSKQERYTLKKNKKINNWLDIEYIPKNEEVVLNFEIDNIDIDRLYEEKDELSFRLYGSVNKNIKYAFKILYHNKMNHFKDFIEYKHYHNDGVNVFKYNVTKLKFVINKKYDLPIDKKLEHDKFNNITFKLTTIIKDLTIIFICIVPSLKLIDRSKIKSNYKQEKTLYKCCDIRPIHGGGFCPR